MFLSAVSKALAAEESQFGALASKGCNDFQCAETPSGTFKEAENPNLSGVPCVSDSAFRF